MLQLHDDQKVEPLLCAVCGTENSTVAKACSSCGTTLLDGRSRAGVVSALPAGTVLQDGQYSLSGVLGQGGFGITYRGHDAGLDRAVAIKEFYPSGCSRFGHTVLPADTQDAAAYNLAKARFVEEARTLARFRHPGIVDVYAVFEENDTAYMVMEHVAGQTLLQLVEARGMLAENEGVSLITRAGEALAAVHENGMLHRDLKPANMILRDDGNVVLIDFGTARAFAPDTTRRMTTTITPGYAPLEQYGQQARFGAFTDIYALGATLYHLLTGQAPVQAPDRASGVDLVEPRTLNPKLSRRVNDAILWALKINVKERPQSVHEFLESLKPEETEPAPARQSQTAPRPQPARNFAEPTPAPKIEVTIPSLGESIAQMQLRREQEANGLRPAAPVAAPSTPAGRRLWTASSAAPYILLGLSVFIFFLLPGVQQKTPLPPPAPVMVARPIVASGPKREYFREKVSLEARTSDVYDWLVMMPAGNRVMGLKASRLIWWNARTGRRTTNTNRAYDASDWFSFSEDGKWITGMIRPSSTAPGKLYLSSVNDTKPQWIKSVPKNAQWTGSIGTWPVKSSARNSGSKLLVACGNKLGQIIFFNRQGKKIQTFHGYPTEDNCRLAMSDDRRLLALTKSNNGSTTTVEVRKFASKKLKMSVSLKSSITSLAFSRTGILAATASTDGTAEHNYSAILLNASNGKILPTIPLAAANRNSMDPLRFSWDGRHFAIIHNRSVWLYRVGTSSVSQARYAELRGDVPGNISDVSFTPNDKELLCVTDTYPAIYSWNFK